MKFFDRYPLRVLLVAATVALVALGLIASSAAVTLTMRSQLIASEDAKLREAMNEWAATSPPPGSPSTPGGDPLSPEGPSRERPPSEYFIAVRTAQGDLIFVVDDNPSQPELPDKVTLAEPFELPDAEGGGSWRALADVDRQGNITVLAVPMSTTVDGTVNKLIQVQALVGLAVLIGVGTCAWLLVRRSLRPLQAVEQTAHQIADGNFDRRLPELSPRTEVGSLAQSFNWMAGSIESAFTATEASRHKAAASEERMRRFVADAGHELRTPLTSIIGFAELYRTKMLPDADAAFGRIEPEARRMQALVEDLLTLARLDTERPMSRDQVDLTQVAADAVAGAHAIEPTRSVELRLDAAPVLTGDGDKLRQVALNLVVNALRHAGEDANVTVTVSESVAATGGPAAHTASIGPAQRPGTPLAVLEVDDDGVGMPAEAAATSFERFHRIDDSRNRSDSGGGSGLGLSIVAGIVQAHAGTVHLDTAPESGAHFRVELPIQSGEPMNDSKNEPF